MKIPTVRVKRIKVGDICDINEADFDAKLHKLVTDEKPKPKGK